MAKTNRKPSRWIYSVHPTIAYAQAVVNNLPKTTGKSIDEWVGLERPTCAANAGQSNER